MVFQITMSLLALGRSGSNTLRDILNQRLENLNFGEVLGE